MVNALKKIGVLACGMFLVTGMASAEQWPVLIDAPEQSVEGKPKSLHLFADGQNEMSASIDARLLDKASKQTTFLQFSVRLKDCIAEKGTLTISNIDGTNPQEQSYLFGGDNHASYMAETICKAAMSSLEEAGKAMKPSSKAPST